MGTDRRFFAFRTSPFAFEVVGHGKLPPNSGSAAMQNPNQKLLVELRESIEKGANSHVEDHLNKGAILEESEAEFVLILPRKDP